MKLTIIPFDSFVAVDDDGSHQPLDLTNCGIPDNVHALQWFETKGWIEFIDPIDPFIAKQPNEIIDILPAWANNCLAVREAWTPPPPPPPPEIITPTTIPVTTIE